MCYRFDGACPVALLQPDGGNVAYLAQ